MSRFRHLDRLLVEALRRSEGSEREEWIEQVCAGDQPLQRELCALIRAHEAAGSFLSEPLCDGPVPTDRLPFGRADAKDESN